MISPKLQEKFNKIREDLKRTVPVFIGSFNPPHLAHWMVCNQAVNTYGKCLVVPAFQNPFKEKYSVSFKDRLKMCEIAFGSIPNVQVSGIEENLVRLFNSDKLHFNKVYSIELFEYLNDELNSGDKIYKLLIGSDCLAYIHEWKDYDKLLRDYGVIYFDNGNTEYTDKISQNIYRLKEEYPSCISFIVTCAKDLKISSSFVRKCFKDPSWYDSIAEKSQADVYLPAGVAKYISDNNLYVNG